MNKKSFVLSMILGFSLSAVLFAAINSGFPYASQRWPGFGNKRGITQFAIAATTDGASSDFVPGVTNTNKIGTTSLRFSTINSVLGNFSGIITGSAGIITTPPAAETIASAGTITANGCGTIKKITSPSAITTGTTNTFTAPATANSGCFMYIVNSGTSTITLDTNALFISAGAADVVVTANDSVGVVSDGSAWYQTSALLAN